MGAVVTAELHGGTGTVAADLDAHAIEGAFVVVSQAIHSAHWSELLFAIAGSAAGAGGDAQLAQTVEQAAVFIGEAIHSADRLECFVAALARKQRVSLFEGHLAAGPIVGEGHVVPLSSALVEISD